MRFNTTDLLSKYGFDDGDMLNDFIVERGERVDFKTFLCEVVTQCVHPLITQKVVLGDWRYSITPHNPIRAHSVDGVEVDGPDFDHFQTLTPEFVDVSLEKLEQIYEECVYERKNCIEGDEW